MAQFSALPMSVPSYHFVTRQNYSKLSTDLLAIVGIFLITSFVSERMLLGRDVLILVGLVLGWYIASKITSMYNDFRTLTFINEILAFLPNLLIQFGLISIFLFYFDDNNHARSFSALYILALGSTITLKMYIQRKVHQFLNHNGINQRTLVVIGESEKVKGFSEFVRKNNQFGYTIVGTHFLPKSAANITELNQTLSFLEKKHKFYSLDELIIISENFNEDIAKKITQWTDSKGVLLRFTPRFLQFQSSRFTLEQFGNQPLISVRRTLLDTDYYWILKCVSDVGLSLLALILLGVWLIPVIIVALLLESEGPIFIKKKLIGQGGQEFDAFNFRTTKNGQKTTIGQFLVRTQLDKFPLLINVLQGSMSLVGPKAYKQTESSKLENTTNNYRVRYKIRPGLIDWTEFNHFDSSPKIDSSQHQKRVDFDNWYIENWNPLLDFQVILKTLYKSTRGVLFASEC